MGRRRFNVIKGAQSPKQIRVDGLLPAVHAALENLWTAFQREQAARDLGQKTSRRERAAMSLVHEATDIMNDDAPRRRKRGGR